MYFYMLDLEEKLKIHGHDCHAKKVFSKRLILDLR